MSKPSLQLHYYTFIEAISFNITWYIVSVKYIGYRKTVCGPNWILIEGYLKIIVTDHHEQLWYVDGLLKSS